MKHKFIEGEINTAIEQKINSLIMEQSSEIADKLTELECKLKGIECFTEEAEGYVVTVSYTEEAQEIFDAYYDEYVTKLYSLFNEQLEVI